jgi:hypothetical protein
MFLNDVPQSGGVWSTKRGRERGAGAIKHSTDSAHHEVADGRYDLESMKESAARAPRGCDV